MPFFRSIVCFGLFMLVLVAPALPVIAINEPKPDNQDAAVYPNPATDFVFVRTDRLPFLISADNDVSISIVDILGNPMKVQKELIDVSTYRVNLSQYPSGYYLLIIQCNDCPEKNKTTIRFLKQ